MPSAGSAASLRQPVLEIARRDFATLRADSTIAESLAKIRTSGLGERIVYFYVVDEAERLVGVIPTRRLLTTPLEQRVAEVMIDRIVTLPVDATALDAQRQLAHHRLLAIPVLDGAGRILGGVDIGMFAVATVDLEERRSVHAMFETLGFRIQEVRDASPLRAFRFRFPWLLSTIGGGTVCALVASAYGATLAASLVLAFFLTLVLGLGESVAMQSMTVAIQSLRAKQPTLRWYARALGKEAGTATLIGAACGLIVGGIVRIWRGDGVAAIVIGTSLLLAIVVSAIFGLTIPTVLHALRLDPKVAAGPIALALTDICTLLIYFSVARVLL
jgi:magnesium transporter